MNTRRPASPRESPASCARCRTRGCARWSLSWAHALTQPDRSVNSLFMAYMAHLPAGRGTTSLPFAVRHDLCGVEGPSKGGLCGVVAQVSELIDRRVLLAGIAGVGALAATSARAQLPNWIQQPAAHLPPPVDYLAVARKQLAMQARNIPQTDRVGVVDFGLPSSRPRFALVDMVAGRIEMFPVTHGRGSDPQHDGWLKSFSNRVGSLATSRGAYRTRDYYRSEEHTSELQSL